MKTIRILGQRAARLGAFWWLAIAAGPPVAWLAASIGLRLPVRSPWVDLLVLALWSVGEEIVFRGAIQPWLAARIDRGPKRRRAGRLRLSRSNAATSALFAAFHAVRHPVLGALAVFPVSLVYGMARERSGRTWPAAVLHLYYNGSLYAASALLR